MPPPTTAEAGVETLERGIDRFYGKYRGVVADTNDPLQVGRLQARVPEVLGEAQSGWALPCAPYGGAGCGLFTIPPVGAGVWIEFEAGDPSRPVWTGTWWGTGDVPSDEQGATAQTTTKILRSEFGLIVSLDDSKKTITLSDSSGTNLISIKTTEGTIDVKSSTSVTIEASTIYHGQGATHPAVYGDDLLQYLSQLVTIFNAHMHPGELAAGVIPVTPTPPVAPMTPPTPSLLSTKNLVG
jgi:type VI secretion system (T6SS) baseplate-like injector VgrG